MLSSASVHLLCGGLQSLGRGRGGDRRCAPAAEDSEDCASHQASIGDGEVSQSKLIHRAATDVVFINKVGYLVTNSSEQQAVVSRRKPQGNMKDQKRIRQGFLFKSCIFAVCARWNFSVGNFELKLVPEMQPGINFLEGELANGDSWKESQWVIADEPTEKRQAENHRNQNQHLDLVIKVSVPDWKVMAFSTGPDAQLVWEHQVRCLK